ncbi:exonuclease domain-containing protein [Cryobacterium sp. BB307]|uniref:exonuclease domain-containing protein n=1 Tax=Cryobacterium sp. BB307 TaxID=2716317 RepID=UPI001447587D|nr:exonuclease domain-containing protein [Cryobacterium sp. BB307]
MPGPGFAVIDFETTGLFPSGHDRAIEVAVVHTNENGVIEGQWETLINPGRDLGRQDIHCIRAADIVSAPAFAQIAPDLVELLDGRVIVAHNASFDTRFLVAELERTEAWVNPGLPSLCTMQLARDFLPGAGRALSDCCAAFDIELVGAHRAVVDALATARLLSAYIEQSADRQFWYAHFDAALEYQWPKISGGAKAEWFPRPDEGGSPDITAATFLQRITEKMPEYAGPAQHVDYLALLDRCLLDRHLSVHESQALVSLAEEVGLSRNMCQQLHLEYFNQLTDVAWSDGVLTGTEMADLVAVGNLLDISTEAIAASFDARETKVNADRTDASLAVGVFALSPGDLIVLTGEMMRPRSEWEEHLRGKGFTAGSGVTKKVKLVAAADPDSLSGKAKKARDYGIPIVDEATLMRLMEA